MMSLFKRPDIESLRAETRLMKAQKKERDEYKAALSERNSLRDETTTSGKVKGFLKGAAKGLGEHYKAQAKKSSKKSSGSSMGGFGVNNPMFQDKPQPKKKSGRSDFPGF